MVASHVLVLHQGQTVVAGAVHDLLECSQARVRLLVDEPQVTRQLLAETMETVHVLEANNGHFVLSMALDQVPLLNRHLVEAGVTVRALIPMRSLEAYFLSIT